MFIQRRSVVVVAFNFTYKTPFFAEKVGSPEPVITISFKKILSAVKNEGDICVPSKNLSSPCAGSG